MSMGVFVKPLMFFVFAYWSVHLKYVGLDLLWLFRLNLIQLSPYHRLKFRTWDGFCNVGMIVIIQFENKKHWRHLIVIERSGLNFETTGCSMYPKESSENIGEVLVVFSFCQNRTSLGFQINHQWNRKKSSIRCSKSVW